MDITNLIGQQVKGSILHADGEVKQFSGRLDACGPAGPDVGIVAVWKDELDDGIIYTYGIGATIEITVKNNGGFN